MFGKKQALYQVPTTLAGIVRDDHPEQYDDEAAEWTPRQLTVIWYTLATIVGDSPDPRPGPGVLDALAAYLAAVERISLEGGMGSRARNWVAPLA